MKTVSLLQPEASQARTSCGEPYAKKPKRVEGENRLNMIQSGMEGVQFQAVREGRKERERAKVFVLSGANNILASQQLSKNNVKT